MSLWVCGRGRGANPLAHVLQAIDEPLDLMEYNSWNVILPEGQFLTEVGSTQFEDVLRQVSPGGIPEWRVSSPTTPLNPQEVRKRTRAVQVHTAACTPLLPVGAIA